MNPVRYLKEKGIRRTLTVLWRYKLDKLLRKAVLRFQKNKPLLDAIVMESHNDFDSNGGAFYAYLLEQGINRRYTIIWLLKNKRPDSLPENVKAYHLYGPSLGKAYWLCRAKYICCDSEIPAKLREDQKSVFCDHGAVGLKSVRGLYDVPKDVDFVLAPSENYAPTLAREYGLEDALHKFQPIGYPYHDVFWQDTPDELLKLTDRLYDKVFLWMPTFRKGGGHGRNDSSADQPFGIPLMETDEEYNALQRFLAENNSLLIIKIHPMQDPSTLNRLRQTENIRILTGADVKTLGIDNYRLVKSADALISDYSSIAFSYILLDRPLAFVLSDRQDYKLGFAMDNPEDFLTGHRVYSFADFYAFLESVLAGEDAWGEKRRGLASWLYTHHDGDSCARLAQLLELE